MHNLLNPRSLRKFKPQAPNISFGNGFLSR